MSRLDPQATGSSGWQDSAGRFRPGTWLGFVTLFVMMLLPLTHQPLKYLLLGALLFSIFCVAMTRQKLRWSPLVLQWTLLLVTTGMFFMLYGLYRGGSGAVRVGTVYVLWPLAYTFFIGAISNFATLRTLILCIVVANIGICFHLLSFIMYAAGFLPESLYFHLEQSQRIGFQDGYIQIVSYSVYSMFFTETFLIAALLTWPADERAPCSRKLLWFSVLLGAAVALLTGRRALWLVLLLAPFFTIVLATLGKSRRVTRQLKFNVPLFVQLTLLLTAAATLMMALLDLELASMVDRMAAAFDFQNDFGASTRRLQFLGLMEGWAERPLFGNGLGTGSPYMLRSIESPWVYELSYAALLFHTGVVGVLIYSLAVIWIIFTGIQILRRSDSLLTIVMLPVLVGFGSVLFANATNPYLASFDSLWTIFLPVSIINLWYLEQQKATDV